MILCASLIPCNNYTMMNKSTMAEVFWRSFGGNYRNHNMRGHHAHMRAYYCWLRKNKALNLSGSISRQTLGTRDMVYLLRQNYVILAAIYVMQPKGLFIYG